MKIAFFTDTYHPQFNGVVTSIDLFTKELRQQGHTVEIFAPTSPDHKSEKHIHPLPSLEFKPYPGYRIGFPVPLLRMHMLKNFDIIHVHTPASVGVAGLMAAKKEKIPLLGTFHTLISEYTDYIKLGTSFTKEALWKYTKHFYNRCDRVIAPTERMKKELLKHGIRKPIHVIPTGIEMKKTKKNRRMLRKRYGFSQNDKIILHVGRLSKEKNIDFIIDRMKGELKHDKNLKLIITSDGPYRMNLMKRVKTEGLEDSIIFTGFLDNKKLQDFYYMSDVFVMASKTETQGIVLLEAAINRLPIVVAPSPVIADLVKENKIGLVAKNFSKGVLRILNNKEFARRFMNKRLQNYDIKNCTKKLISVYETLANNQSQ